MTNVAGASEAILRGPPSLALDLAIQVDAERCERSLYRFYRESWHTYEPAPFVDGWHLQAIAEHLEAVTYGQIRRLLINIKFRSSKTSLIAIAWPAWVWALKAQPGNPLLGPGARFLMASYNNDKAKADALTARRLIASDWYQQRWGRRVRITPDRDSQSQYDTTAGGSRINTGIPESLGKGGHFRVCDDAHKTDEVESDSQRESVLRNYQEIWATRANDPNVGAEVVVMQRLHEHDLSGYLLDKYGRDIVHLSIPAWYEEGRHCTTYVNGVKFWTDPRSTEGEYFWPQRMSRDQLAEDKALGEFAFAGQCQQSPIPRGGSIIRSDYWQSWPPEGEDDSWWHPIVTPDGKSVKALAYPEFDLVIASLDGAFSDKESADYSALTVWGIFKHRGRTRVMLINAWRDKCELHQVVQAALDICRHPRRPVSRLLIENKASGIPVAQELMRQMREQDFMVEVVNPVGDKRARLLSVQPMFEAGMVFRPWRSPHGYTWANMVTDEMASFPRAKNDDLTDSASQALLWLRRQGMLRTVHEQDVDDEDQMLFRGNTPSIAQRYGLARAFA